MQNAAVMAAAFCIGGGLSGSGWAGLVRVVVDEPVAEPARLEFPAA